MTSVNVPSRLLIPCPFASKPNSAFVPIEAGSDQQIGTTVNFRDGFPDVYGVPASGNGKYVKRGEMNAIGDLASRNQFLRMCGSIVTFDSEFATAIGGYPAGAVLQWRDGNYLRDVVSLVDNNMYNFVTNGVDGTNWKLLNPITPDTEAITIFSGSIGSIGTNDTSAMSVNVFSYKTPRKGVFSCCVQPGTITTVTGITGSGSATLAYKNPTAASYTTGLMWQYGAGTGSVVAVGTELDAGAILTLYVTVSGCKYSSFNITAKLM